jgi:hypothetical protein
MLQTIVFFVVDFDNVSVLRITVDFFNGQHYSGVILAGVFKFDHAKPSKLTPWSNDLNLFGFHGRPVPVGLSVQCNVNLLELILASTDVG